MSPFTGRFGALPIIPLLALGFVTLLAIVWTTIWLGERAQTYVRDLADVRNLQISAVELRNSLITAESSQRGFLATGNEIYLAPYRSAKSQTIRQLEILKRNLAQYQQDGALVQRLNTAVEEKIREMDNTITLKDDGRDADALTILRTNRGKALTDESNVYLSGIILRSDERLTALAGEQTANARWLRGVAMVGSVVIVLVVGMVIVSVLRYTREIAVARDEVRNLNKGLEERVSQRTADLEKARDRAQVLLAEVNHRVTNSLSMVVSLVKLQTKAVSDKSAKDALSETEARIYAIASVHKRLYTSGDVRSVALDEYLSSVLEHLAKSLRDEGNGATLKYDLESVTLQTDASVNLGVVTTELVTNAFKYAYPDRAGEVRVRLRKVGSRRVELVVEDDGVGREAKNAAKGTGLGNRIIHAMAETMKAEMEYVDRGRGTTARLTFPLET